MRRLRRVPGSVTAHPRRVKQTSAEEFDKHLAESFGVSSPQNACSCTDPNSNRGARLLSRGFTKGSVLRLQHMEFPSDRLLDVAMVSLSQSRAFTRVEASGRICPSCLHARSDP